MQEICNDIRDISLDVAEKAYRTNILSMFAMCEFAPRHMKHGASIINSCSVAAYTGNLKPVDYPSTKGVIATFTQSLAQQAPNRILINAVAPGIM